MNMNIENNMECFVQLWLLLEHTRQKLLGERKRFCIRRVLQLWFGFAATDDFIWEVCTRMSNVLNEEIPVGGYDQLPSPTQNPRKLRELLRAIVAVKLGIGMRKVNLCALDKAYKSVFNKSK